MQRPEPDIIYFDDVIPRKLSPYCRPIPSDNGRLLPIILPLSLRHRAGGDGLDSSFCPLFHCWSRYTFFSAITATSTCTGSAFLSPLRTFFNCDLRSAILSNTERKLICSSSVVQISRARSTPELHLTPTRTRPGCTLPCCRSVQSTEDTASWSVQ